MLSLTVLGFTLQELSSQLRDANLDVIGSFTNTLFADEDEMVARLRLLPGVTDLQASFKDKVLGWWTFADSMRTSAQRAGAAACKPVSLSAIALTRLRFTRAAAPVP